MSTSRNQHIPSLPVPWGESKTLEQAVIGFFQRRETSSEEFKTLLAFFGRERITKIWEDYTLSLGGPKQPGATPEGGSEKT